MDIDAAIEKLSKFKKLSSKFGMKDCNVVGLDNESFTVRVKFSEDPPVDNKTVVLGFNHKIA